MASREPILAPLKVDGVRSPQREGLSELRWVHTSECAVLTHMSVEPAYGCLVHGSGEVMKLTGRHIL